MILASVVLSAAWLVGGCEQKEKVLDVGPIEATAENKESVPIPPLLAGIALVSGVVLVAASARKA